ncbi:MAG TPA: winged helix-turn-helix domain-containing protein [Sphingomicrobium sp.]|nr:winged helix-turn-helix domain-containing protein [Sphingomicrobium sp.]
MDRAISLEARRIDLSIELPFQLGRAGVDPSAHEIGFGRESRRLQPLTMKVLVALHDKLGGVVTRDELVDRCWDGRIVGEDVINRCISLLRRVADESGGFEIQTVPRGGYRLVEAKATAHGQGDAARGIHALPIARRRLILAGGGAAIAAAAAGGWIVFRPRSNPAANRIAVLPFANLTGDPAQAYFSDGIAEEVRSALSRVGMQVIGRTSCEAVRNLDAKSAAAKLGVQNILIGSVRRSGTTIRMDAQLLRGSDGVAVWSQTYDRAPGDVIKIQTDIAEKVASALSAALGTAARNALTAGGTQNPQAQRLLLQALAAARAGTAAGCQRALKLLDEATAADGYYGDAFALKGYLLEYYAETYASTFPEVNSFRASAVRSLKVALRLAPTLARAHWALANYLQGALEFARSDAAYRRAVALAPGDAEPLSDYSLLVLRIGNTQKALELADRALALDPLDPDAYRRRFLVLYYRREFAKAVAFSKQVERYSPELFIWPVEAGLALIWLDSLDEAERYMRRGPADYYQRLVGECVIAIRRGARAEAEAKLASFRQSLGDLDNYQYAEVYAQLGEADRAFAALSRAWSMRDTGLSWLRVDPMLDPIRNDPRFGAVARRLGLRDHQRTSPLHPRAHRGMTVG